MHPIHQLWFMSIALLFLFCSGYEPDMYAASTSEVIVEAINANPSSIQPNQKSTQPAMTSHQAYMMVREYVKTEKKLSDKNIHDFSVRYDSIDRQWQVHMTHLPQKPGGFFTVYVSDKDAKVLKVEGGE